MEGFCGEVVDAGDVVGENLRGGDPVIEGEVECDGFLVGEVAHEECAFEGKTRCVDVERERDGGGRTWDLGRGSGGGIMVQPFCLVVDKVVW